MSTCPTNLHIHKTESLADHRYLHIFTEVSGIVMIEKKG